MDGGQVGGYNGGVGHGATVVAENSRGRDLTGVTSELLERWGEPGPFPARVAFQSPALAPLTLMPRNHSRDVRPRLMFSPRLRLPR